MHSVWSWEGSSTEPPSTYQSTGRASALRLLLTHSDSTNRRKHLKGNFVPSTERKREHLKLMTPAHCFHLLIKEPYTVASHRLKSPAQTPKDGPRAPGATVGADQARRKGPSSCTADTSHHVQMQQASSGLRTGTQRFTPLHSNPQLSQRLGPREQQDVL